MLTHIKLLLRQIVICICVHEYYSFIGIVNGNYPCKTWELNGNNISLICRIKNQVEPVTFIDSNWNLKDKCTLNNTRKCEIFQINADTIAHTYKNEVVLMINDYERKCVINDEWTCSEGNSTFKTVVPTSKGKQIIIQMHFNSIIVMSKTYKPYRQLFLNQIGKNIFIKRKNREINKDYNL